MRKNEYLVQIHVVEARDLNAKDSTGTSDPFVRISVGNLPPQVSTAKSKTTTAVFNQNFTFAGLKMSDVDFENFEAKIEVFDQNQFFQNEIIGCHSIGLATLYRYPQHEIYNKWLPLTNPSDVKKEQGFLLVSAYIIGETDQAPVHDANENNVEDEPDEFGGVPDDQLTGEQLQRRREKAKQIAMVLKPKPYSKQAQLLVNLVKAEDLPILNGTSMDSFISVRVNGITQITGVVKNQQKPQYRSRMMFPVTFPLNNDKIVIRIWDRRVCMSDTFVGQIPEFPSENDFFNILYLQSKGGVLPFRWFSIYGVPKEERPSGYEQSVLGYKKSTRGTTYMGRVLLSLNLSASEKPEKCVLPIGIYREPQLCRYTIRMDTYEINQAKGAGETVTIRMRCGGQKLDSDLGKSKGDGTYIWGQKKIVQSMEVEVPRDIEQQTDLIIELLSEEKKRVAYIRMPTTNPDLGNPRPVWYEFKEVKCHKDGTEATYCYALLNLIFRPTDMANEFPRQLVKRNMKLPYICRCYMYAGYDFCPDKLSEELDLSFEIRIGDRVYKSKLGLASKNPIWNQMIELNVSMEQNLEFVSNIVISFNDHGKFVGNANVAAMHCQCGEEEMAPVYQFYHVMLNGRQQGRILFGITLQKMKKNAKLVLTSENIQPIVQNYSIVKVLFSVYAVRQLPRKLKMAQLTARISIPSSEKGDKIHSQGIALSKLPGGENETIHSPGYTDPNFLELITLECRLPNPPEPLFTPQVEIELRTKDALTQKYYSSIPLIGSLLDIDPIVKSQIATYFILSIDPLFSQPLILKSIGEENDDGTGTGGVESKQGSKKSKIQTMQKTIFNKGNNKIQEESDEDDNNNNKQQQQQHDSNEEEQDDDESELEIGIKQKQTASQEVYELMQNKGIENSYVSDQLELEITENDINAEIADKKSKGKQLTRLLVTLPKEQSNEVIKNYIKKEVLGLAYKPVEADIYMGLKVTDLQDDGIDYGRDILKGPYEDELLKQLPYKRINMYELNKSASGLGQPTIAIMKADVRFQTSSAAKLSLIQTKQSQQKSVMSKVDMTAQQDYLKSLKLKGYPFDFFDPVLFEYLRRQQFRCKVRVYIYRCLSLAAQAQNIDTYHYMAGQQAQNSANPWIEVEVGEPGADPGDYVKMVSDPDRYIENTLCPNFFRSFELDGLLPMDSSLHIRIMHKAMLNSLIGAVKIDIEDRLMGEKKLKSRMSFQAYKDYFEVELEKLKYAENAEQQKTTMQAEIADLTQKIESFTSAFSIPVEYQQLRHPDKLVSQGTVEMFVEVLPIDIARVLAPAKMIERQPQEYEVRMIIWETFEIPKTTKKVVDIYVMVTMDSSATGNGTEEVRETDVHMGSEDGNGEFNWRMKFNFKTPCQFPRMKLSVLDFSTFGASPSVGETTISLKRVLSVMRTQSQYDMAPTIIKLTSASFPGQERGSVLLQMSILQKNMADAKPVGEAQNEPNIDPFLKKPTAGRGLGDFFKGFGMPWGMICKQVCMILLPMLISALVSFILFVKPGIAMPKP